MVITEYLLDSHCQSYTRQLYTLKVCTLLIIMDDNTDALATRIQDSITNEILAKNMKYIKIADREKLGWKVIRHYTSDM